MDVVKIKIGSREYDIKDATVRSWMTGNGPQDFKNQVLNLIRYGVADTTGYTPEQLAEMEAAMKREIDPVFIEHIAAKLVASVDEQTQVLTLVSE